MALTNPAIILETDGLGTTGFTFSILGPQNPTTQEYPFRAQGENPKFTADYLNAPFVAGTTYLLEIKHPEYEPDGQVVRVTFDTAGNALIDVDPAEQTIDPLTGGTDLPIILTDAEPGDIMAPVLNEGTGLIDVVNAKLYTLFPELRYRLGLGYEADALEGFVNQNGEGFGEDNGEGFSNVITIDP